MANKVVAYVTSYNEFDRELITGLKNEALDSNDQFVVVGYLSKFIEEKHVSAGFEIINLNCDPVKEIKIEDIESLENESIYSVIFPEKEYYGIDENRLIKKAVRIYSNTYKIKNIDIFVHKLGAELIRKAIISAAKKFNSRTKILGTFPVLFEGRSYYHESIDSERNDRCVEILKSDLSEEFSQLLKRIRNKTKPVTYPYTGGGHYRDFLKYVISCLKNKELNFLYEILMRRVLRTRYIFRGIIGDFLVSKKIKADRYIFFPLHVFDDSQITVRNPQYFHQLWIIEYISRCLPYGYKLVVKLHPGIDGSVPLKFIREIRKLKNIVLIGTGFNTYDVINRSDGVVVINSTVALESLILGKNVLVLGNWAFKDSRAMIVNENLSKLSSDIKRLVVEALNVEKSELLLQAFYDEMQEGSYYTNRNYNLIYKSVVNND